LGYRGLLSTIEFGADGKYIAPWQTTYSKRDIIKILGKFKHPRFRLGRFSFDKHANGIGKYLPKKWEKPMEKYIGQYLVVDVKK
jgi:hypothetical protein